MGFGHALAQLWTTLFTILAAIEQFAHGFKNLGDWTNESTKTFVDEARIDRQKKLAKMEAELTQTQATAAASVALPAPAPAAKAKP